jgi:hypothetical protein
MAREKTNECTGFEARPFGEFVSEPSKSKIECNGERTPSESESLSYALSTNFLKDTWRLSLHLLGLSWQKTKA